MRYNVLAIVLFLLIALCSTSCRSRKEVRARSERQIVELESRKADSVTETVVVAVYDTVREVTTITVFVDTEGDTLRVERITDRDDSKLRVICSEVMVKSEAVETENDSLIVTDTTVIYNEPAMNPSAQTDRSKAWLSTLKWVFWIILAVTVLAFINKNGLK